ncbi:MAG TPA: extracellular solute-binding protein [Candidatus Hydrogenedentes bacterium]|nr:extracellular solute-binding protein [Candidatus Hydrogenedentota bacterium]
MNFLRYGFIGVIVGVVCLINPITQAADLSGDLMIFHAGSLSVPLKEVSEAFEKEHPGVKILREAAGSRECARKISDLGKRCDVLASADYAVIDSLLIPAHAAWNIKFAGNEMIIAYTEKSKGGAEITADNWPTLLMREDVAFGRSDPNADPCGYRTVLTAKLAEKHYKLAGFADALIKKDTRYMRPKETDLLGLLEAHAIDFLFIYRSVAEQHGLKWLPLPDEVNLKKPELAELYRSVSVEISGTTPGSKVTQVGEPMVYGVTIPKNAPNPDAALAFADFLLNKDKGMAIMVKNGQPGVVPSPTSTFDQIPDPLKKYATKQ